METYAFNVQRWATTLTKTNSWVVTTNNDDETYYGKKRCVNKQEIVLIKPLSMPKFQSDFLYF